MDAYTRVEIDITLHRDLCIFIISSLMGDELLPEDFLRNYFSFLNGFLLIGWF